MAIIGAGNFRFEPVASWPMFPRYWSFVTGVGVAVNSADEVHVLSLGDHPLTVWDRSGKFVSSWGERAFSGNPHGIHIGPDDHVWIADRDMQTVSEYAPGGELVRSLGTRLVASPTVFGEPFNMPSGVATTADGGFLVSDGYGSSRVHRFYSDGKLRQSWGRPGPAPGEFALLHSVAIDGKGRIYVCDRFNHRIQVFRPDGGFLAQWTDFNEPCEVAIRDDVVYVAEQGNGSAVSLWTLDHELILRWRGGEGPGKGKLNAAHGIALDSEGSIYVAEVRGDRGIRKFQRV